MSRFKTNKRVPTIDEYKYICQEIGWSDIINMDVANKSLENSVYGVTILDNNKPIGMGRIVGDGCIYFYIQDIAVIPSYQKQGIGTKIMDNLVSFIKENAPEKSFIGLFASEGAVEFYKKYTFEKRDLHGMFTVKELIK